MLLLSLVSGIHSGIIKFSFGLWLKNYDMHIIYLGLFNLILLPYSLKIFWLPFLENINFSKFIKKLRLPFNFGHRKSCLILFEMMIIFITASFYFINPIKIKIYHLIFYSTIYAAIMATKEAMVIAYQMENMEAQERGAKEGKINIAYQTGFWIGGVGLFQLATTYSWKTVFLIFSLVLSILFIFSLLIKDSISEIKKSKGFVAKFLDPYKNLLEHNKKILSSLIIFMILYRLQDRLLMANLNYFFIDLGFKNQFISAKTIGIGFTILGGLASSWLVKKRGYKKTLKIGLIGHAMASTMFLLQSMVFPKSVLLFYIIIIVEKFIRGFEATTFFTYQMIFCTKYYVLQQFSMLVALERLSGSLISSVSGYIINGFGWNFFFLISFFGSLPSLLFLKKLPDKAQEIVKE